MFGFYTFLQIHNNELYYYTYYKLYILQMQYININFSIL
jgi:hypothetical protein